MASPEARVVCARESNDKLPWLLHGPHHFHPVLTQDHGRENCLCRPSDLRTSTGSQHSMPTCSCNKASGCRLNRLGIEVRITCQSIRDAH